MPRSIFTPSAPGQDRFDAYAQGNQSFIPHLLPQTAVGLPVYQTLELLSKRYGFEAVHQALDPAQTIGSPVKSRPDGQWLRSCRMVGINVRTIGTFWNVINYVLTLPAAHNSIHLLPVWEPGVVGSLYAMVSWNINPEFFSTELQRVFPGLDTPEKQLKVVVNLLHLMGRTVGMDVIPHTDRFSEMVLTRPELFEWVRRDGPVLVDQSGYVTEEVAGHIRTWASQNPLAESSAALFGPTSDYTGRLQRRLSLIHYLVERGYETLPMTMAPPYRELYSKPDSFVTDEYGQKWYDYGFQHPGPFSRVFGPLTRYRFYEGQGGKANSLLDFTRPNEAAWTYVCEQYYACQQQFGFDFMRGDMAHVQMRPGGVPAQIDAWYDPLRSIKRYVQAQGVPYFGFFAETFLAPPDDMGYGDEIAHLEAIEADTTLGDLQATVVGSVEFNTRFRQYIDLAATRRFAPAFTVMTADKDDPRFDAFYRSGNVARYFVSLFMPQLPSYVGLGFEVRNPHEQRGANEEYTKLYVFQIRDEAEVDKVTSGPFVWGHNQTQFATLTQLRLLAEALLPELEDQPFRWLIPPDPTGQQRLIAWTIGSGKGYVFVASLDPANPVRHLSLPLTLEPGETLSFLYDTTEPEPVHQATPNPYFLSLPALAPGACRIYRRKKPA